MSLLWRKKLRISLCPDRLVLRSSRSKPVAVPISANPNEPEWRGALQALPAVLAEYRDHDVSLVLADQFVRYALLPWNATLKRGDQWVSLARHRLGAVYGPAAAEWDVKLTETAPAGPRLACAVDRSLLAELADVFVAANARLVSVQPFLIAAFNRLRSGLLSSIGQGSCWLVIEEPGRLTLAFIQRGTWVAIRSRRIDAGWRTVLPDIIERESALLALAQPCTRVMVCAQGAFDTEQYEAWDTRAVSYSELALAWSEA